MKRATFRLSTLAWVALALPLLSARAEEEPPPPPPALGVSVVQSGGAEVVTAVVPGPLGTVVAPGGGAVILLVGSDDPEGPSRLYRLRLPEGGGEPELTLLREDVQSGSAGLEAVDLEGDGQVEVLLGVPGNLYSLGQPHREEGAGSWKHILAERRFDPRTRKQRRIRGVEERTGWFAAPEVGLLRFYRLGSSTLSATGSYPLPVHVRRSDAGLHLTTPRVSSVARPEGAPLFVVGPEAQGNRRLRTVLVDPTLPADSEEAVREAWSMLPGNERVEQSWYSWMGSRPVLIVASQSGDKMGIFEKKRLRVFPLRPDRSRSGSRPVLSEITENLRWYPMRVEVTDVDGDEAQDLVTIQSRGLGAGKVHLEAFLGKPNGRFHPTSKRSTLDIEFNRAVFEGDLDGDGRLDLVTASSSELLVFPGENHRRRLVSKKPRWNVPFGALEGQKVMAVAVGGDSASMEARSPSFDEMAVLPVDDDERPEVILLEEEVQGRGVLKVIRFPAGGQ